MCGPCRRAAFGGALIGACAAGVTRSAFDVALRFARTDRRGECLPVVEHQGVGFLLADVKTRIEAVRALTQRACAALDSGSPGAEELSVHAKIFGSETAVQTLVDLMRVVGVDSYWHAPIPSAVAHVLLTTVRSRMPSVARIEASGMTGQRTVPTPSIWRSTQTGFTSDQSYQAVTAVPPSTGRSR